MRKILPTLFCLAATNCWASTLYLPVVAAQVNGSGDSSWDSELRVIGDLGGAIEVERLAVVGTSGRMDFPEAERLRWSVSGSGPVSRYPVLRITGSQLLVGTTDSVAAVILEATGGTPYLRIADRHGRESPVGTYPIACCLLGPSSVVPTFQNPLLGESRFLAVVNGGSGGGLAQTNVAIANLGTVPMQFEITYFESAPQVEATPPYSSDTNWLMGEWPTKAVYEIPAGTWRQICDIQSMFPDVSPIGYTFYPIDMVPSGISVVAADPEAPYLAVVSVVDRATNGPAVFAPEK